MFNVPASHAIKLPSLMRCSTRGLKQTRRSCTSTCIQQMICTEKQACKTQARRKYENKQFSYLEKLLQTNWGRHHSYASGKTKAPLRLMLNIQASDGGTCKAQVPGGDRTLSICTEVEMQETSIQKVWKQTASIFSNHFPKKRDPHNS